jgi:hypothetical protein
MLYPLFAESFDTEVRVKAFAICFALGNVATVLMPFLLMPLDDLNHKNVPLLFSGLMFFAALVGNRIN